MKRLMLIPLLAIMLFSCNNEEASNQTIEESIIGSWKLVDWYDDVPRDINNDGQASTDLYSQWNGCKKQSIFILSSDHTGKIVYIGDNNNPNCPNGFESNSSYFPTHPWEINEEDLSLVFMGDDFNDVYDIVELNSNTLILRRSGFFTCCNADISYFTGGFLQFEKES